MYRADELTKEVWDYIYFGFPIPNSDIPKEKLE